MMEQRKIYSEKKELRAQAYTKTTKGSAKPERRADVDKYRNILHFTTRTLRENDLYERQNS